MYIEIDAIGKRIKKLRKKLDLSQEIFGQSLGITKSSVSLLESGKNSPSEQTTRLICSEFNVNEVWLRTGETGDENMFTVINNDDRFSLNLGKLSATDNEFVKNGINLLAETEPDKLKILEEFMKSWLGIK